MLRILTLSAAALGSSALLTAAPSTSDQPSTPPPAAPISPGSNSPNPGATGLERLRSQPPAYPRPWTEVPAHSDIAPGTAAPAPAEDIRAAEEARAANQDQQAEQRASDQ